VGKWASQNKKGGQGSFGLVPAPLLSDFTITTPAVPVSTITRNISLVFPIAGYFLRTIKVSDGSSLETSILSGNTGNAATPSAATQYKVQVAFGDTSRRISEYTTLGTLTTP